MGSNTIIARPFKRLGRRKTVTYIEFTNKIRFYILTTYITNDLPSCKLEISTGFPKFFLVENMFGKNQIANLYF